MVLLKGKYKKSLLLLICLCSSTVFSAGPITLLPSRWVVALQGGYASLNASGHSQSFAGTDDDIFSYNNRGNGKNTGFIGAFIGAEWRLPRPDFFMQAGLAYNYFGYVTVNGLNSVGIEPSTSTIYNYRYRFQTQQLLAVARLFATAYQIYHPYAALGMGAAFNCSNGYNATTSQTGGVNLTPTFNDKSQTSFSYTLGVGIDTDINQNVSIGLGYQFTDFGKSSLGKGQIVFNNYYYPVPFSLSNSHAYANQFLVQISYRGNLS